MGMKFLNKKGWHTGSLRNVENVWKAEQKDADEKKKLDEIRKQYVEERQKDELRRLQEEAGIVPKLERLEFLYDSGLATGKGTAEDYLLGKPVEEMKEASDFAKIAETPSVLLASQQAPGGVAVNEKPASANDTWRKLHADPLFLIRQQEQEALKRIRSNPVQMGMLKKQANEEKAKRKEAKAQRKEERKQRKEEKKKLRKAAKQLQQKKDRHEGGDADINKGASLSSASDDSDSSPSPSPTLPSSARREHMAPRTSPTRRSERDSVPRITAGLEREFRASERFSRPSRETESTESGGRNRRGEMDGPFRRPADRDPQSMSRNDEFNDRFAKLNRGYRRSRSRSRSPEGSREHPLPFKNERADEGGGELQRDNGGDRNRGPEGNDNYLEGRRRATEKGGERRGDDHGWRDQRDSWQENRERGTRGFERSARNFDQAFHQDREGASIEASGHSGPKPGDASVSELHRRPNRRGGDSGSDRDDFLEERKRYSEGSVEERKGGSGERRRRGDEDVRRFRVQDDDEAGQGPGGWGQAREGSDSRMTRGVKERDERANGGVSSSNPWAPAEHRRHRLPAEEREEARRDASRAEWRNASSANRDAQETRGEDGRLDRKRDRGSVEGVGQGEGRRLVSGSRGDCGTRTDSLNTRKEQHLDDDEGDRKPSDRSHKDGKPSGRFDVAESRSSNISREAQSEGRSHWDEREEEAERHVKLDDTEVKVKGVSRSKGKEHSDSWQQKDSWQRRDGRDGGDAEGRREADRRKEKMQRVREDEGVEGEQDMTDSRDHKKRGREDREEKRRVGVQEREDRIDTKREKLELEGLSHPLPAMDSNAKDLAREDPKEETEERLEERTKEGPDKGPEEQTEDDDRPLRPKFGLTLPKGHAAALPPQPSSLTQSISMNGADKIGVPAVSRNKHRAGQLSDEERAQRLAEMQADAAEHEDDRWRRLKRAAESDAVEVQRAGVKPSKTFLQTTNEAVYGAQSTGKESLEESVRRRAHFRQRGPGDTSAYRR
eukprot:TRINITY_DN3439_c0_g1_i1.p1 TRINITY_DN3439_c0_g1~~TRINITY_DN3439_c0_g1_i1.p1  ORF type:complete len:1009 (-),score=207.00 TRINITY_DN3439_c0_g1_i1:69-3095(-)